MTRYDIARMCGYNSVEEYDEAEKRLHEIAKGVREREKQKACAEKEPIKIQPVKWISCKDKMPDTPEQGMDAMYSDCCLVCDAEGWVGMAYYLTNGQKSWWEFADAQNKIKIDWTEITHWMPLPEPPKDGEQE